MIKIDKVSYLTDIGNIDGILTINQDIILFDPTMNLNNKNLTTNKECIDNLRFFLVDSISKFQACIQFKDIVAANPIILPTRMSEVG